ncbi:hypothetical protein RHMOL_Rhmol01G0136400 [Rhododendron molle]|uniref:Uncharacterized protein n=1 Tax=Rhododendron molle TaxID=49168 RepID=A0ACC0Q0V1_RHOML|nr:hypothetical protein RHMOL_Rhmol01G0136400 [Rhododendron molle]
MGAGTRATENAEGRWVLGFYGKFGCHSVILEIGRGHVKIEADSQQATIMDGPPQHSSQRAAIIQDAQMAPIFLARSNLQSNQSADDRLA